MTQYSRHREKWKDCELCPLHETRGKVVLCRGQLPCDVLFVGEAPGIGENVIGQPFVGPAGKLLDRMIQDALIQDKEDGDDCVLPRFAFTNVIACIPYDEDGRKVSDPPEKSVKKCLPRLVEMIMIAKPKAMVCVGLVADKWMKKYGADDLKTTLITHPAAILRANPASQGVLYQRNVVILSELFEEI